MISTSWFLFYYDYVTHRKSQVFAVLSCAIESCPLLCYIPVFVLLSSLPLSSYVCLSVRRSVCLCLSLFLYVFGIFLFLPHAMHMRAFHRQQKTTFLKHIKVLRQAAKTLWPHLRKEVARCPIIRQRSHFADLYAVFTRRGGNGREGKGKEWN